MKYLGWESDYIINRKIIIKENYTMSALEPLSDGSKRLMYILLMKEDKLKVLSSPTRGELIFRWEGNNICYIYHNDIRGFMEKHCYSKQEYREERINKLLDE